MNKMMILSVVAAALATAPDRQARQSFEMEFGSFFWIRTPVRLGLTYSYNSGRLFEKMQGAERHHVSFIFNIELPK